MKESIQVEETWQEEEQEEFNNPCTFLPKITTRSEL